MCEDQYDLLMRIHGIVGGKTEEHRPKLTRDQLMQTIAQCLSRYQAARMTEFIVLRYNNTKHSGGEPHPYIKPPKDAAE